MGLQGTNRLMGAPAPVLTTHVVAAKQQREPDLPVARLPCCSGTCHQQPWGAPSLPPAGVACLPAGAPTENMLCRPRRCTGGCQTALAVHQLQYNTIQLTKKILPQVTILDSPDTTWATSLATRTTDHWPTRCGRGPLACCPLRPCCDSTTLQWAPTDEPPIQSKPRHTPDSQCSQRGKREHIPASG